MSSNDLRPAHHIDAVNPRWLFPLEQAHQPPRNKGCEHNGFVDPALPSSNGSLPTPSPPMLMSCCILPSQLTTAVLKIAMKSTPQTTFSPGSLFGVSPSEDHSAAVGHFAGLISRASLAVADTTELFESIVHNQSPSSIVNRHYEAWEEALTLVQSSEERRSRHQAVLSLKRDTVACEHLCQVHLHRYVVATLKALFDTIRQCTATCANALIATGIGVAIRRICVERDFCAAPLDAVLAKIAHIVVIHDDLSRLMSPACSP